jgi:hypothetical protein
MRNASRMRSAKDSGVGVPTSGDGEMRGAIRTVAALVT